MIAYTNYNEELEENESVQFRAEDQEWDEDTLQELKEKYNVIYLRGVQALMLVKSHYDGELLVMQGFEDDGLIQFPRENGQFLHGYAPYWLNNNLQLLKETKEFVVNYSKDNPHYPTLKDVDW